jgi:hypothetical protein
MIDLGYSIIKKKIVAKERYQGYDNAYPYEVDRFAG